MKTKDKPDQERDEDLDALMAETFGNAAEDEYLEGATVEDEDDEDEGDEAPESDEQDDDGDTYNPDDVDDLPDDEEEDEDEDDDDSAEEDSPAADDEPGESEDAGEQTEGDGADDTQTDGLIALDMMADQTLKGFVAPSDDFDPASVGTVDEFIQDAREAFGDDYDAEHIEKMGKATYKTAIRTAKKRHEAGAESRLKARRDQDAARLTAEIHKLGTIAPDELARVDKRMARIYQQKVDKFGEDAAASISAEVYFRLAGGKLGVPSPKAKNRQGVASQKAKAQKKGAVRGQQNPDQVGRVRTGPKKRKNPDEVFISETNSHLTRRATADFLFGD